MKIKVEVDIFDDPEYCLMLGEECEHLGSETHENYCSQFFKYLSYKNNIPTKCDGCKAAYAKATHEIDYDNLHEKMC